MLDETSINFIFENFVASSKFFTLNAPDKIKEFLFFIFFHYHEIEDNLI